MNPGFTLRWKISLLTLGALLMGLLGTPGQPSFGRGKPGGFHGDLQ